jgi:hypothetical protein
MIFFYSEYVLCYISLNSFYIYIVDLVNEMGKVLGLILKVNICIRQSVYGR